MNQDKNLIDLSRETEFQDEILIDLPRDTVFIDSNDNFVFINSQELVFQAIKKKFQESLFNASIERISDSRNIFNINGFIVKVIFKELTKEKETIDIKKSFEIGSPQIFLLVGEDKEINAIYFEGVLTGNEINKLIMNLNNDKSIQIKNIQIPKSSFSGGINKLISIINAFDSFEIDRISFIEYQSNKKFTINKVNAKQFIKDIENRSIYSVRDAIVDLNISFKNNIKDFRNNYNKNWKRLFKKYNSINDNNSHDALIKINRAIDLLDSLSDDELKIKAHKSINSEVLESNKNF